MAQDSRQGFGVHAAGQRMGRECVSEVVKADVGQPGFRQKFLQLSIGTVRLHRGLWPKWIVAGVGFGISCHQPAALFPMKSAVDFQSTATLIEVRPHEAADLTPAQAGGQFSIEEVVPDCVFPDHIHKDIQLFLIQNFHWLMDCLGWVHFVGRVDGDEPLISRRFERMVKRGVYAMDGGAGEPRALTTLWLYSAVLL